MLKLRIIIVLGVLGVANLWAQDNSKTCSEGKDPDQVIAACTAVIGQGSNTPSTLAAALASRGKAYSAKNNADHALQDFDKAIGMDPKNVDLYLGKCRVLAAASRHKDAIPVCSESLRLNPNNAEALRDRGHYFLNLGEVPPALDDLMRARQLAPRDRGVYYHLGVAYYLQGNFAEAAKAYQGCLDNSKPPETVECIAWLYPSLVRAGRKQDAAALLATVKPDPAITGHPGWYLDRLLLFAGERTEEQVAANLNAEGALSTSSIGYSLGLWHLLNGRTQQARDYFEKAVATNFTPAWGYRCSEAELKRLR